MDGVQLAQGYSHFEETVYFLTLCSQKFLVLTLLTIDLGRMKDWVDPGATQWFLSTGPLDWKSSALTTRPLLQGLLFIFLACISFQKCEVVKNWLERNIHLEAKFIINGFSRKFRTLTWLLLPRKYY